MHPDNHRERSAGEARRHSPSDGRPAAHAHPTILDRIDAASEVADLDAPAKPVLVALTRHTDAEGRCHPSIARLAARTGYVERTVRRALGDLEDRELIARWRDRRADGTLTGYRYRVNLAALGLPAPDVEGADSPPPALSAGPPPALSAGAPPDSLSGGHERTTGLSVHRPPDSLSAHEVVTPEGEPPPRAPAREAEPVQHPLMAAVREGGEDDDHRHPDEPPDDAPSPSFSGVDPQSRDAARALADRLDLGARHVPDRLAAAIAARLAEGWTVADLARAVTDADAQYGGPLTKLDVGARPAALATRLDRLAGTEPPAVRREREAAEERARREAAAEARASTAEAHALADVRRQALDQLDDVTRARFRTDAGEQLRAEHGIPPGMPVPRALIEARAVELAEDAGLIECATCDPDRDPIGATA